MNQHEIHQLKGVKSLPTKLPQAFIQKMENLLDEEASAFFSTYNEQRTAGFRINLLKITMNEWNNINPFQTTKIPFVHEGFYYDIRNEEPGKHPYHASGLYYIQEPSAMFIATLLDAKPYEKVLDLCAAPGGKSTQIAGTMNNTGLLVSNEIHPKRAKILSENIERFGITNSIVTNESPEKLANHFPYFFDKILVDAPCSGEGMFRKDEEATEYWSQDHVEQCHNRQMDILDHAYQMLRENGVLIYSTCTFSPEENEQVIEELVRKYPDLELLPIEKNFGMENGRPDWTLFHTKQVENCARLWPHKVKGEGHFVAKLKKRAVTPTPQIKEMMTPKKIDLKDFYQFKNEYLHDKDFLNLHVFGTILHELPEHCPNINGLKVLRCGLHLGEMKKNRFEPNHALAIGLKTNEAKQIYPLESKEDQWRRYLKGETLKGTGLSKGWILVTVDGFPLGWGKESDSILKNMYPKGLRIM